MTLNAPPFNAVRVERDDEGHPTFHLGDKRVDRMRGYKVSALSRTSGLAWVTVEFLSNDVDLYGHAPTDVHSEHVDDDPPNVRRDDEA